MQFIPCFYESALDIKHSIYMAGTLGEKKKHSLTQVCSSTQLKTAHTCFNPPSYHAAYCFRTRR